MKRSLGPFHQRPGCGPSDDGKSDDSDEDLVTPPKRRNRNTTGRGRGGRGGKRGRGRGSELRNHAIDDDSDTDEDDDDYVAGPVAPRPSGGSHAQSCRRGQDHRVRSVRIPAQRTENQMGGPNTDIPFCHSPRRAQIAAGQPYNFCHSRRRAQVDFLISVMRTENTDDRVVEW